MGIAQVLRALPQGLVHPDLLVGTETSDDAGVFRLTADLALVQTLDFFPPLVDDPYTFGQIAATNALSDVYAMNGRPITAMNIVAFPDNELSLDILAEITRGAADKVTEAGAVTLGGHSVRDAEVKFGLSVTGLVDPAQLLTNASTKAGDVLVLTKPLGTGLLMTANKKSGLPESVLAEAVVSMTQLNVIGRDAARDCAPFVHALTDVTGYGLTGHASEMAEAAGLTFELNTSLLPRFAGVEAYAIPQFHSRASKTNRSFLDGRIEVMDSVDLVGLELAFDPQTSGGLLIAIDPKHADRLIDALKSRGARAAQVIGRATEKRNDVAIRLI